MPPEEPEKKKKRKVRLVARMVTCKKCGWSFSNQNPACPSCGTAIGFLSPKEMIDIIQFYVDLKGLYISEKEAKDFVKEFKKKNKKWPSEMDIAIFSENFLRLHQVDTSKLKREQAEAKKAKTEEVEAKEPKDKKEKKEKVPKKKKEKKKKEKVKPREEEVAPALDLEAKIAEMRAKRQKDAEETPAKLVPKPIKPEGGEVKCEKCGFMNPPESRFCLECGENLVETEKETPAPVIPETKKAKPTPSSTPTPAPVSSSTPVPAPVPTATSIPAPLVCPSCDHKNPPDSRFCFECGTPLAQEHLLQPTPPKGLVETIKKSGLKIKEEPVLGSPEPAVEPSPGGAATVDDVLAALRQKRSQAKQSVGSPGTSSPKPTTPVSSQEKGIAKPRTNLDENLPGAPPIAPSPAASDETSCPKCGKMNPKDSLFCLECGEKLK